VNGAQPTTGMRITQEKNANSAQPVGSENGEKKK
jgi:hypothetical protein